jgi:ferredoxin-NADP reductase
LVRGVEREGEGEGEEHGTNGDKARRQDQIQLVTKIEQSLGNCPKYLNQYTITPAAVTSELVSQGPELTDAAKELISKADMFFLSTSTDIDMDTNHRGGPPGFVRIVSSTQIVYPEYSGNRLYQSLGNLRLNPAIGLTFPDYETGNVLYTTGKASILVGADAARLLPGSNLAVLITLDEVRFVGQGLPFRGAKKDECYESPYNPAVRRLATEGNVKTSLVAPTKSRVARLTKKTLITPSLARFTFTVDGGIQYQPGQWIALDFKSDLDIGYSHMRNDDPRSLNDDFVRTFTISSVPSSEGKDSEFDMTIRSVGPVTRFLFQQNERAGIEVPILGVGGSFNVAQASEGVTPFVAGGVGITPLLGQLGRLEVSAERFRLLWTVRAADVGLVVETLGRHGRLVACTDVFLTGELVQGADREKVEELKAQGVRVERRRIEKRDVEAVGVGVGVSAEVWYVCAGKQLTKAVAGWVGGREVVSEGFDY